MILTRSQWQSARADHERIVRPWVQPRLDRRKAGRKHPVDDFLFDYYANSPGKLLTWHPGYGTSLEIESGDAHLFAVDQYESQEQDGRMLLALSVTYLEQVREAALVAASNLRRAAARTPLVGCFALHEWAMVVGVDEVRHSEWPLRLTQDEIRKTIDELGLRCTHFDAFRFFTAEAQPQNPLQLTRKTQWDYEQPACLHANMDLYRWAYTFAPLVGSSLVREAFALARQARTLDMQVAPYELSKLGVTPIPVETAPGRAEFATAQRALASTAEPIRARLIAALEVLETAHR